MGLFFDRDANGSEASLADQEFIDLRDHEAPGDGDAPFNVRVAEMHQVDDLKAISGLVYEGDLLMVDFGPLEDDEVAMQRITKEFKRIADDVGGDVAGFGENTLIVAPEGVDIDRRKVRVQS
jgi:SepF-like predicted cell division protein (DUF552 family)